MPCKSKSKTKKKYSKSKKLGSARKPLFRKKKPINSIKTGETKHFKYYVKGNKHYYIWKAEYKPKK